MEGITYRIDLVDCYLSQENSGEISIYIKLLNFWHPLNLKRCNMILDKIKKIPDFDPMAYATYYSNQKS